MLFLRWVITLFVVLSVPLASSSVLTVGARTSPPRNGTEGRTAAETVAAPADRPRPVREGGTGRPPRRADVHAAPAPFDLRLREVHHGTGARYGHRTAEQLGEAQNKKFAAQQAAQNSRRPSASSSGSAAPQGPRPSSRGLVRSDTASSLESNGSRGSRRSSRGSDDGSAVAASAAAPAPGPVTALEDGLRRRHAQPEAAGADDAQSTQSSDSAYSTGVNVSPSRRGVGASTATIREQVGRVVDTNYSAADELAADAARHRSPQRVVSASATPPRARGPQAVDRDPAGTQRRISPPSRGRSVLEGSQRVPVVAERFPSLSPEHGRMSGQDLVSPPPQATRTLSTAPASPEGGDPITLALNQSHRLASPAHAAEVPPAHGSLAATSFSSDVRAQRLGLPAVHQAPRNSSYETVAQRARSGVNASVAHVPPAASNAQAVGSAPSQPAPSQHSLAPQQQRDVPRGRPHASPGSSVNAVPPALASAPTEALTLGAQQIIETAAPATGSLETAAAVPQQSQQQSMHPSVSAPVVSTGAVSQPLPQPAARRDKHRQTHTAGPTQQLVQQAPEVSLLPEPRREEVVNAAANPLANVPASITAPEQEVSIKTSPSSVEQGSRDDAVGGVRPFINLELPIHATSSSSVVEPAASQEKVVLSVDIDRHLVSPRLFTSPNASPKGSKQVNKSVVSQKLVLNQSSSWITPRSVVGTALLGVSGASAIVWVKNQYALYQKNQYKMLHKESFYTYLLKSLIKGSIDDKVDCLRLVAVISGVAALGIYFWPVPVQ